jgi:hypothetical protein
MSLEAAGGVDGKHWIFDAAAGIACDSVFLIRHGFQVYTNEVDSLLAGFAKDYAPAAQRRALTLDPPLGEPPRVVARRVSVRRGLVPRELGLPRRRS